jgi:hypothetical protein
MVAERHDQRVIKERASGLIILANARVLESEGWQVSITDAEGREFGPASLEKLLGPGYSWSPQEPLCMSPQYQMMSLAPQAEETSAVRAEQAPGAATHAESETETLEDETLEAESFDELASLQETGHYDELEPLDDTDEYADFEPYDEEELEDELEPHQ